MALTARIVGLSLVTGGLGAALGISFFGKYSDYMIPTLCLGCVGAIVGAVAGAAREIVAALHTRQPRE